MGKLIRLEIGLASFLAISLASSADAEETATNVAAIIRVMAKL